MSRRRQRSAFDQVFEFDRGRMVPYRDCGLCFREIGSLVGRNQTTVMRICDCSMQEGFDVPTLLIAPTSVHYFSCVMYYHTGPAPGIMVWGGIGYHSHTPLVRITGTLNIQRYISEVLEPVVGLATAIFQQDNARLHVERIVQMFFVN
ncbi:transposable element Tcb1 transposase [Trichonephila clavipes]|nr:transposable element Tcb1 transposase [Trichonephila clavipes]